MFDVAIAQRVIDLGDLRGLELAAVAAGFVVAAELAFEVIDEQDQGLAGQSGGFGEGEPVFGQSRLKMGLAMGPSSTWDRMLWTG